MSTNKIESPRTLFHVLNRKILIFFTFIAENQMSIAFINALIPQLCLGQMMKYEFLLFFLFHSFIHFNLFCIFFSLNIYFCCAVCYFVVGPGFMSFFNGLHCPLSKMPFTIVPIVRTIHKATTKKKVFNLTILTLLLVDWKRENIFKHKKPNCILWNAWNKTRPKLPTSIKNNKRKRKLSSI